MSWGKAAPAQCQIPSAHPSHLRQRAGGCAGIGYDCTRCKLRIRTQLQGIFDGTGFTLRRPSASNDETAVWHAAVVAAQFFQGDEMYRGVILVKIIGHGDDLTFNFCQICTFLGNNPAFAQMFITR